MGTTRDGAPASTQNCCGVANPHVNRYTQHGGEPPCAKCSPTWVDSEEAHWLQTRSIVNDNSCHKGLPETIPNMVAIAMSFFADHLKAQRPCSRSSRSMAVAQFVTVERRIAPPPAVPERSVPVSEHSAPQCPDAGHAYRAGDRVALKISHAADAATGSR